jgi:hypothetical protein
LSNAKRRRTDLENALYFSKIDEFPWFLVGNCSHGCRHILLPVIGREAIGWWLNLSPLMAAYFKQVEKG